MVYVGFICEGQTEVEFLSSANFINYLSDIGLSVTKIINAEGSANLLTHNISPYIEILIKERTEKIIILTDLDTDACITITKQRINARPEDVVIVAAREIESWFLANTLAMRKILNSEDFYFEFPEKENKPFETVNQLLAKSTGRGIGKKSAGKLKLISLLLNAGLDITQAAAHPNCPSAAYFLNKLNSLTP